MTYSSIRHGLYTPIRDIISPDKNTSFLSKFFIGLFTGAIGSMFVNPIDLIKIRQQSESGLVKNSLYTTGL